MAADYIFTGNQLLDFELPGTLKTIVYPANWISAKDVNSVFPVFKSKEYLNAQNKSGELNFVIFDCFSSGNQDTNFADLDKIKDDKTIVICLRSSNKNAMPSMRRMLIELMNKGIQNPVILFSKSSWNEADEHLVHFATETGALLLDGFGDGIYLTISNNQSSSLDTSGRNYISNKSIEQFINNTAFSILQATRTRISKTEYISCPSCGRTLFDLQQTTAKIRSVTNHLKGVKIAIMGCIVNGPGEMADADFGYVGSGVGKITLYKSKQIIKRNIDSAIAVDELINLLKESGVWTEPVLK